MPISQCFLFIFQNIEYAMVGFSCDLNFRTFFKLEYNDNKIDTEKITILP